MSKEEAPIDKFKTEIKSVFIRWWEESDLDDQDMTVAIIEVCEDFCGESVEFDSEINLDDIEDE